MKVLILNVLRDRFAKRGKSQIHQFKMLTTKWNAHNGYAEQQTKKQMG